MWDGGSTADQDYAVFQAKLRAGEPLDDPAEDEVRRVVGLLAWWFAVDAVVGGAVLWFWDPIPAVVAIVILDLGWMAAARRRAKSASHEPDPGPALPA